jgi:hypothetical protein
MRKNKGKGKKTSGTNLKVSPLKTYKKQTKRMKNRLKDPCSCPDAICGCSGKRDIYKARLERAELHLKNYDKEQEQKKADEMKVRASKK